MRMTRIRGHATRLVACTVILTLMCLSVTPPARMLAPGAPDTRHWAERALRVFVSSGQIRDSNIDPDRPVTNSEFLSMMCAALGLPEEYGGPTADGLIRRDEAFFAVCGALSLCTDPKTVGNMARAPLLDREAVPQAYGLCVDVLYANRLLLGYPDNTCKPSRAITLAESAALLHRGAVLAAALASLPDESPPPPLPLPPAGRTEPTEAPPHEERYAVDFVVLPNESGVSQVAGVTRVEKRAADEGSYVLEMTPMASSDVPNRWLLSSGNYVLHLEETAPADQYSSNNIKSFTLEDGQAVIHQTPGQSDVVSVSKGALTLPLRLEAEQRNTVYPKKGAQSIVLTASTATIAGTGLKLYAKEGALSYLGGWINAEDFVRWDVMLMSPGRYDVTAKIGVRREGGVLALHVGDALVWESELPKTPHGWNDASEVSLGTLTLPAESPELHFAPRTVTLRRRTPAPNPNRDFDYAPNIYEITLTPQQATGS